MLEDMREGDWVPKDAEDVHTAIEAEVTAPPTRAWWTTSYGT